MRASVGTFEGRPNGYSESSVRIGPLLIPQSIPTTMIDVQLSDSIASKTLMSIKSRSLIQDNASKPTTSQEAGTNHLELTPTGIVVRCRITLYE